MDEQFFSFDTGRPEDWSFSTQFDGGTTSNFDVNQMAGLPAYRSAPERIRIPSVLHSLYDGPFRRCLVCERELLKSMHEYLILKWMRRDEPLAEYAICTECNDDVWRAFSEETRRTLEAEFQRCVDWEQRRFELLSTADIYNFDIEPWIRHCLLTGKALAECDDYQLLAHCEGPYLLLWDKPWMRSGESLRYTRSLWSSESRREYDDFVEKRLGPTPTFAKELPRPMAVPV